MLGAPIRQRSSTMPDPRHRLGHAAEAAVASWLTASGWRVVGRGVRSPGGGEVDLVALDRADILVAIEVRARRSARAGTGAESVDARKAARMGRTLTALAAVAGIPHRGLRLDVVSVMPEPGAPERWRLRRIPGVTT
jgi:putative endonuclease